MIDKKDELIIEHLKQQGDLSTYKLSKLTKIPQTTILNRINKLKKSGVIKKFTIELNYSALDKKVKALIFAKVNKSIEKDKNGEIGSIESKLLTNKEVLNVKRILGEFDFVIEVIVKDIESLNNFLIKKIRHLEYLSETETIVVLDEWK